MRIWARVTGWLFVAASTALFALSFARLTYDASGFSGRWRVAASGDGAFCFIWAERAMITSLLKMPNVPGPIGKSPSLGRYGDLTMTSIRLDVLIAEHNDLMKKRERALSSESPHRAARLHWLDCHLAEDEKAITENRAQFAQLGNRELKARSIVGFAVEGANQEWLVRLPAYVCLLPISVSLCVHGAALFRKRRRRRAGLCLTCGYDLRGNASGRCPECGTMLTPTLEPH